MKASEFVKKHGLNEVKKILQCAPDFALSILDDGDETDLCDLRCLVESHDLVESLGGLEKAKELLVEVTNRDHRYAQYFEKPALEKAIADVEACR